MERFGSAAGFNAAVQRGVVGKLEAAHLYNEACDHFYGCNGKASDQAKALELFRAAAELGHPEAQYKLGMGYDLGEGGLEKDKTEAVRWFRRAGAAGTGPPRAPRRCAARERRPHPRAARLPRRGRRARVGPPCRGARRRRRRSRCPMRL